MKHVVRIMALLLAMLCLAGCGTDSGTSSGDNGHAHTYGDSWQKDAQNHWLICECGEKKDMAAHTYENNACTTCGAYKASDGLEFEKTGDYYTLVGVAGNTDVTLVIPAEYEGAPVKMIGRSYALSSTLQDAVATKIVVSEGITQINARAFWSCETVEAIELPESLLKIEHYAFWTCTALKEIKIPEGINAFGEYTFSKCSAMTRIYIPASVTSFGAGTFNECSALTDIDFGGTMAQWEAIEKHPGETNWDGKVKSYPWDREIGNYTVHCTDGDITK